MAGSGRDSFIEASHTSELPASVLKIIDGSQKFAEGRGVRLEVRSDLDVRSVCQLADIKMACKPAYPTGHLPRSRVLFIGEQRPQVESHA